LLLNDIEAESKLNGTSNSCDLFTNDHVNNQVESELNDFPAG